MLNTAISFAGAGLGFLNQVVLMGRFFQPEELGLTRVLFQSATLIAQFMVFGTHPMVVRFFNPDKPIALSALRKASWTILGLGILLSSVVLVLFNESFVGFYSEKSSLFVEFAAWAWPMAIGLALYQLLAGWAQVTGRSVLETGLKEIGLRFLFTLGISAYLFNWIPFDILVEYYALTPIITAVLLGLLILKKIGFGSKSVSTEEIPWRQYFSFAAYNLFSRTSNFVTLTIDVILLGALVGLEAVAVYSIATYLVSFVVIPNRAVQKVAFPRIALWWQDLDQRSIQRLYGDTSSGLLFWSGTLYLGIFLAAPIFIAFLGPEYRSVGTVFAVFGFGRMIEMATSVNRGIIRNSPAYKWETYYSILFMVTMVVLDIILIPYFENRHSGTAAVGAAWGSVGAFALFNGLVSTTLYMKYRMHPFRRKQIFIAFWLIGSFVLLPRIQISESELWNSALRMGVFGLSAALLFGFWYNKKANHNWLALK